MRMSHPTGVEETPDDVSDSDDVSDEEDVLLADLGDWGTAVAPDAMSLNGLMN